MRPILLALATLALAAQDERAFLESMARLEKQDPAGKKDLEAGSPLRAAALAMDPAKEPEKARYAAASWLWATSLIRGLNHGVDGTYLKAARGQADLQKAWALLETVGGDLARPRNAMRLEVAWRLLDPDRMKAAYAAVAAQPALNPRELIHCFFVAAHLGEWDAMRRHAQAILAQGGKLESLHASAEEAPAMFDYESLLKAVETGRPERVTEPLAARSFRITKTRVKIRRVSGHDKTLLKESETWPRDWVAKPDPAAPLLQVGTAAHWVEGPALPPVSGFMQKDRLYLVGYKIAQGDAPESGRQDQAWDMRPESGAPDRWRGLNTLTIWRAGTDPKAGPALQVTFDAEWDLRPLETLP
jgi:hypothetical protein